MSNKQILISLASTLLGLAAIVAAVLVVFGVDGCALAPDSLRPELEHSSHLTQHFGADQGHYSVNTASVVAHWDLPKRFYLEAGEGIALNGRWGGYGGVYGYGEVEGNREQTTLRMGRVFNLKKE